MQLFTVCVGAGFHLSLSLFTKYCESNFVDILGTILYSMYALCTYTGRNYLNIRQKWKILNSQD